MTYIIRQHSRSHPHSPLPSPDKSLFNHCRVYKSMARRSFKSKRRRRSSSTTTPPGGDHEGNGVNVKSRPDQPPSLEEDLRRQRLRQQKREKVLHDREALDEDASDTVRDDKSDLPLGISDAVYAEQRITSGGHLTLKEASSALLREKDDSIRLPSSLVLGYALEATPIWTSSQRGRIRQLFQSRYLMDTMAVNSRASALYGGRKLKWVDHTLPDGLHCSWDLTCKYHLHPSARTMDVAMMGTDTRPTVATVVQGGWAVFRPPTRTNTMRDAPVQAIRLHGPSGLCGTVLRPTNRHHLTYQFKIFNLARGVFQFGTNLDLPIHDFCFGHDLVLFSCPRYHSGSEILPLFLPLQTSAGIDADGGSIRKLNVRNFPQSDALRVEMACDHGNKFVAFGHRNGQTSLLDLRTSNVCTVIQYDGPGKGGPTAGVPLGSVSDLGFLPARPSTHMLVKRSFGNVQLHDLRKSTSAPSIRSSSSATSSMTRNGLSSVQSSTTVIQNMAVPTEELNSTLSANCNGFATDPCGGQTLLSPYVNKSHDACLGIWSLGTGLMIGSRVLLPNSPDRQTAYVELCQNRVPAFSSSTRGNDKGDSDAWATWLKCGAYTRGKISSKVGSLHELSFPGRWN